LYRCIYLSPRTLYVFCFCFCLSSFFFFFSSRRRHTRFSRDWSSDVCSSDLSAFRSSFASDYGVKLVDGPLAGLTARAVVVIGEDGKVLHTELVSEVAHEPNYEAALKALA